MTIHGDQLKFSYKDFCLLATTGALTYPFTGSLSIDGYSTATGNRILVKNQAGDNTQNGIWVANDSGAWSRSDDWNNVTEDGITYGIDIFIQYGTANAGKTFRLTTVPSSIPGATAFTDKTPSTLNGAGTNNRIVRWDGTDAVQDSTVSIDDTGNILIPSTVYINWGDTGTFITANSTGSTGDMQLQTQHDFQFAHFGDGVQITFEGANGDIVFNCGTVRNTKLYWATGTTYPTSITAGYSKELTLRSDFGINLIIYTPGPGTTSRDYYSWIAYKDRNSDFEWGRDVFPGLWRSGVLVKEQISVAGNNAQVTSALPVWFTSNPASGSILYLKDTWYNRSYGFGSGGDVTVTIGGTVAETLQNLATAIQTDGYGAWKAVYRANPIPDQGITDGIVIIYCTNQADLPWVWTDRAWVNATMGTMYAISCTDCGDYRRIFGPTVYGNALGTVDPGVQTFGPYWRTASLHTGDKFTALFDGLTYTLDKSTAPDSWNLLPVLPKDTKILWGPNSASWVEADGTTTTGDMIVHAGRRLIVETGGSGTNKYVFSETGDLGFKEVSAPNANAASWGQYYVKDDSPNTAAFQDDAGNNFDLLGGKIESVNRSGTGGAVNTLRGTRRLLATLNSSANVTWNLRPASEMSGVLILLKHIGDGTGTCTIDPDGGETIDGGGTKTVPANTSMFIWSEGTTWYSV